MEDKRLLPERYVNQIVQAKSQPETEVEFRFGNIMNGRVTSGITWIQYQRILSFFRKQGAVEETHHFTTEIAGEVHHRYGAKRLGSEATHGEQDTWYQKVSVTNLFNTQYAYKLAISREIPIEPVANFQPKIVRHSERHSFSLFKGLFRADFTRVDNKYELELEVLSFSREELLKMLIVILRQKQDTIQVYSEDQKRDLISWLNQTLGGATRERSELGGATRERSELGGATRDDVIDHRKLVQARNLRIDDMVYGGLVGNPDNAYTLSHKVDGVRKLLVIWKGVWLVMAPDQLMWVSSQEQKGLTGTILDGELIPLEKRYQGAPDAMLWYIPFDSLCQVIDTGYSTGIQQMPHVQRLNYAQNIANRFKTANPLKGEPPFKPGKSLLHISTKNFKTFTTPEEFFSLYREFSHEQVFDGYTSVLPYHTDGMIVTPTQAPYLNGSDSLPLKDRVLTKYPDIAKIKPVEELTIDLKLDKEHQTLLMANKGNLVPFTGTNRFPLEHVDWSKLEGYPNGSIVEFRYKRTQGELIPTRLRVDKFKPNQAPFVLDTWKLIHTPLTYDLLSGNSFDLVRRYHNRIKRQLLEEGSGILLDIGSGRGGDVSKWSQYQHVYAVEPYHVEELEKRIAYIRDKVTIIQAKGEDTAKIAKEIPNKVDVISLMLSLSFFWSSQEVLEGLVNTIRTLLKPTGKILFLTIDGDLVKRSFGEHSELELKQLELGPASLILEPPKLYIKMPGTILEEQTSHQQSQYPGYQAEWLVHLDDLILRLPNYRVTEIHRADGERFLSQKEWLFTQMYTYGVLGPKGPVLGSIWQSQIEHGHLRGEKKGEEKEKEEETEMAYLPQYPEIIQEEEYHTPGVIETSQVVSPRSPRPCVDPGPLNPYIGTSQLEAIPIRVRGDKALNDDSYLPLNFDQPFHGQLVRLGTISDGSCFFHAVLKAYYKPYADNPSYSYRHNLAKSLRDNLATVLALTNPETGVSYYQTANKGAWSELASMQRVDNLGNEVDYSLQGMQALFRSDRDVGDEVFSFVADMLGLDLYVLKLDSDRIRTVISIIEDRPAVVIGGNGRHYETIGVLHKAQPKDLIQTVFWPNDPLVQTLRCMFKKV